MAHKYNYVPATKKPYHRAYHYYSYNYWDTEGIKYDQSWIKGNQFEIANDVEMTFALINSKSRAAPFEAIFTP